MHRINNNKIVSAQQATIAYNYKITYAAQQQAIWEQGSLWIKIKIRYLYTMVKPTTMYQAYRILTTFSRYYIF
jgi:hypothetical protein